MSTLQPVPNFIQAGPAPVVSNTKHKRQSKASRASQGQTQQNIDMSNLHSQTFLAMNNAQLPAQDINNTHQTWDIHNQVGQQNGLVYTQQPAMSHEVFSRGNIQGHTTQTGGPQNIPQQIAMATVESKDDSSSSSDDDDDGDLNQLGAQHIQIVNYSGMPAEGIKLRHFQYAEPISTSISVQISHKLKKKIWRNQFIDIALLLPRTSYLDQNNTNFQLQLSPKTK